MVLTKISSQYKNPRKIPKIGYQNLRDPERFRSYVLEGGKQDVEGWLQDSALTVVALLASFQQELGLRGGICEVGVHHGLLFIALCLLRAVGEKAVAIDVFEDQQFNIDQSGCGDCATFVRNIEKHIGSLTDISIFKSDSMQVKPEDIVSRLGGQSVRLFSVDGCHTKEHTLNDLSIAQRAILPGGIIILDDFYNPWWPGVNEAAYLFLKQLSGMDLGVIAYGNNKLLLTTKDYCDIYHEYIQDVVCRIAQRWRQVDLWGYKTFVLSLKKPPRFLHGNRYTLGTVINFQVGGNATDYQTLGWFSSDRHGAWTQAGEAALLFYLDNDDQSRSDSRDLCLSVAAATFFPPQHNQRFVQVFCNQQLIAEWSFLQGESFKEFKSFIPNSLLHRADPLEIVFLIDSVGSPKDSAISPDPRQLGILIKEVCLLKN